MSRGYIIASAVFLLAFLLVLYRDRQRISIERLRIQKFRNGKVYGDLYPFIRRLRRKCIEQITITNQHISFIALLPVRQKIIFNFSMRGHRDLSELQIYTLAQLLKMDMPLLMDKKRYLFKKDTLSKGARNEIIYTYTMKTSYKDALHRSNLKQAINDY